MLEPNDALIQSTLDAIKTGHGALSYLKSLQKTQSEIDVKDRLSNLSTAVANTDWNLATLEPVLQFLLAGLLEYRTDPQLSEAIASVLLNSDKKNSPLESRFEFLYKYYLARGEFYNRSNIQEMNSTLSYYLTHLLKVQSDLWKTAMSHKYNSLWAEYFITAFRKTSCEKALTFLSLPQNQNYLNHCLQCLEAVGRRSEFLTLCKDKFNNPDLHAILSYCLTNLLKTQGETLCNFMQNNNDYDALWAQYLITAFQNPTCNETVTFLSLPRNQVYLNHCLQCLQTQNKLADFLTLCNDKFNDPKMHATLSYCLTYLLKTQGEHLRSFMQNNDYEELWAKYLITDPTLLTSLSSPQNQVYLKHCLQCLVNQRKLSQFLILCKDNKFLCRATLYDMWRNGELRVTVNVRDAFCDSLLEAYAWGEIQSFISGSVSAQDWIRRAFLKEKCLNEICTNTEYQTYLSAELQKFDEDTLKELLQYSNTYISIPYQEKITFMLQCVLLDKGIAIETVLTEAFIDPFFQNLADPTWSTQAVERLSRCPEQYKELFWKSLNDQSTTLLCTAPAFWLFFSKQSQEEQEPLILHLKTHLKELEIVNLLEKCPDEPTSEQRAFLDKLLFQTPDGFDFKKIKIHDHLRTLYRFLTLPRENSAPAQTMQAALLQYLATLPDAWRFFYDESTETTNTLKNTTFFDSASFQRLATAFSLQYKKSLDPTSSKTPPGLLTCEQIIHVLEAEAGYAGSESRKGYSDWHNKMLKESILYQDAIFEQNQKKEGVRGNIADFYQRTKHYGLDVLGLSRNTSPLTTGFATVLYVLLEILSFPLTILSLGNVRLARILLCPNTSKYVKTETQAQRDQSERGSTTHILADLGEDPMHPEMHADLPQTSEPILAQQPETILQAWLKEPSEEANKTLLVQCLPQMCVSPEKNRVFIQRLYDLVTRPSHNPVDENFILPSNCYNLSTHIINCFSENIKAVCAQETLPEASKNTLETLFPDLRTLSNDCKREHSENINEVRAFSENPTSYAHTAPLEEKNTGNNSLHTLLSQLERILPERLDLSTDDWISRNLEKLEIQNWMEQFCLQCDALLSKNLAQDQSLIRSLWYLLDPSGSINTTLFPNKKTALECKEIAWLAYNTWRARHTMKILNTCANSALSVKPRKEIPSYLTQLSRMTTPIHRLTKDYCMFSSSRVNSQTNSNENLPTAVSVTPLCSRAP